MEMTINFPEGQKVNASFGPFEVKTDQPKESGGNASAPDPFSLFLSSIGTCTGIYILRFCQERDISTIDLSLKLTAHWNDALKLVDTIDITINAGKSFPKKYKNALLKTAKLCTVKRNLEKPPAITLTLTT